MRLSLQSYGNPAIECAPSNFHFPANPFSRSTNTAQPIQLPGHASHRARPLASPRAPCVQTAGNPQSCLQVRGQLGRDEGTGQPCLACWLVRAPLRLQSTCYSCQCTFAGRNGAPTPEAQNRRTGSLTRHRVRQEAAQRGPVLPPHQVPHSACKRTIQSGKVKSTESPPQQVPHRARI